MSFVKRLLHLAAPRRSERTAELPEAMKSAIASRRYDMLSVALGQWQKSDANRIDRTLPTCEARRQGWTDFEIEKLEIFVDHFLGDERRAFDRAKVYTTAECFDPDLYMMCLVALFKDNQFANTYQLLMSIAADVSILTNRADYWQLRALACWSMNDMAELRVAANRMCQLAPDEPAVIETAVAMFHELGDLPAFEHWRQRAIEQQQPGYVHALTTLALGDYAQGFREMEARYDMVERNRYLNEALFSFPRWHGESLSGKTLLISVEQGLGDTIQFVRYLPHVQALEPKQVVIETQLATLPLLQFNFPSIQFLVRRYAELPSADFDLWVGSMSLPHVLGSTFQEIPATAGYLRVAPESSEYWRDRVTSLTTGHRPRIGLAWSGQPVHRADFRRSIPFARMMEVIRDVNADFFALQTSVPEEHPDNLIDVSGEMVTLADTAALIQEMDIVVTVDTSVVHVAGAIGKETWLLLPYRYEWRWGLEGEGNRWYDSVRVIRQSAHGDWDSVLNDVFAKRFPVRFCQ